MQKQHFKTDDDLTSNKYAKPYGREDNGDRDRRDKRRNRDRGDDNDEELRQAIELSK